MREILFKAKRLDNGEWINGDLIHNYDGRIFVGQVIVDDYKGTACDRYEIGIGFNEVDPTTICQYTGLTDKNGNKIWENDICDRKEEYPEIVKYHEGDFTLDYSYAVGKDEGYNWCNLGFYVCQRKVVEVIGNIFDNPELVGDDEVWHLKNKF